jgi:hypothetical protein
LLGALASAALLVAAPLTVGQAILGVCGMRRWSALAGPVGLAALLCAAGITAGWGGRGAAIVIALGVITIASIVVVVRLMPRPPFPAPALIAAGVTGLAAAIPFIASGHFGILGVGLVNDDMANHLLLADWIDERFRPEPVLVDQGYPLGPHALVAGLAALLGTTSINVFAGLTLAIPVLTALVAYGALAGLRPWVRSAASIVVALPYLAAAYLAQEAFKEPIMALFLLAFALLLAEAGKPGCRVAVPLGVIAAGVTYVYSFPGLAWLGGVALLWGALAWLKPRGVTSSSQQVGISRRAALFGAGAALAALVILMLPEIGRFLDFIDFRALHPDRANEGGLGNLPGHLSPLEALGIWPTSEFRLSASASNVPALLFYAGGLLALVALILALPRWLKTKGPAIPAALLTAAVLYLLARAFGTVYTSAKALAIAAPLIALITLGGLAATNRRPLQLLAAVFAVAVAGSSFLILRQAPVAPTAHANELAQIRPVVDGQKVLFLGRDDFVAYELRGAKPYVAVRNFYVPDTFYAEPNQNLTDVFEKFDFDSVTAQTLAEFPYVITTAGGYQSGPPPGYQAVEQTGDYILWRKGGSPLGREPGETDAEPGSAGGCPPQRPRTVSSFSAPPVQQPQTAWSQTTVESGESATATLDLPAGRWNLSLQYDATRPITVSADGFEQTLPGNLDFRGPGPYWPAGVIDTRGGPVAVTVTVEDLPLAGRLLGAHSVAHLGPIAATDASQPTKSCDGYVDWYIP